MKTAVTLFLLTTSLFAYNKLQNTYKFTPNIAPKMLSKYFWIDRLPKRNKLLMNEDQIRQFNLNNQSKHKFLTNIYKLPEKLEQQKVKALISAYRFSQEVRYKNDLKLTTKSYYAKISKNLNLTSIPKMVPVTYGIATERASVRAFPTDEVSLKTTNKLEFDRFQETEIDILTPVAILHTSLDRKWYFIQMYNYSGWTKAQSIATVKTKWELGFLNSSNYLVVTGSRVFSNLTPISGKLVKVPFSMGTIVPLVNADKIKKSYHGQNPQLNYVVLIPTRSKQGTLKVIEALIPIKSDVSIGHLPYTKKNLLSQLFKMAGERYSWGGSEDGRDCSKFILDAYSTMGIILPRNSSQLKKIGISQGIDLSKVKSGSLLYSKGHVMIYLGRVEKNDYIIHSKSIFENLQNRDKTKAKRENVFSVLVSDLSILPKGKESILETREYITAK